MAQDKNEMHDTLEKAAKDGSSVRFLRLACKRKFREEIIRGTDDGVPTPAVKLLQDTRLRRIEMILANPFCASFLERMDEEKKQDVDISRIHSDIVKFAKGILRLNSIREALGLPSIRLAFHSEPLIWNLCIVGDDSVIVRAYFAHHSGHDDSVRDEVLKAGQPTRLAESFLSYYDAVSRAERTKLIHQESDLDTLGTWPDLFKGNSTAEPEGHGAPTSKKLLQTKQARDAEDAWLNSGELVRGRVGAFRPRPIAHSFDSTKQGLWPASDVVWMNGCNADVFVGHLQEIAAETREPDVAILASQLASFVVSHALDALRGFRIAWKELQLHPSPSLVGDNVYPWEDKITQAVHDCAHLHAISSSEERKCTEELRPLVHQLGHRETVIWPFRDAHLKNRFIEFRTEPTFPIKRAILRWMKSDSLRKLEEYLAARTWDFDFESTRHGTNEWDDPLHILWCSHISFGGGNGFEQIAPESVLKAWWRLPSSNSELTLLRHTLLARSLREFCRRMWYLAVMPQTYERRYGGERTERFATIALETARRLHLEGVANYVTKLIAPLRALAPRAASNLPLLEIHPPITQRNAGKKSIFISYSRLDTEIVDRLDAALSRRGYHCIVDRTDIVEGNFKGVIVDAVDRASLVVVLLTENSLKSDWVPPEVSIAHDRKRSILPLYWEKKLNLRNASGGLYFDIVGKNLHHEILSESRWDECIGKIARACDAAHAKVHAND